MLSLLLCSCFASVQQSCRRLDLQRKRFSISAKPQSYFFSLYSRARLCLPTRQWHDRPAARCTSAPRATPTLYDQSCLVCRSFFQIHIYSRVLAFCRTKHCSTPTISRLQSFASKHRLAYVRFVVHICLLCPLENLLFLKTKNKKRRALSNRCSRAM